MYKALEKNNAEVKITIYPEAGHDSWTESYSNNDIYTWLLHHKRIKKGT
jgi:hypothetical protein